MADFLTAAASTLETASVAPRDSDSPIAASALCVFSVAVVEGLDAAAALLAAAASAFATFETRIASPAAVSTLFTVFVTTVVFVMAFRPGHRALADAAGASPLAAALAPDPPVSEVDTDPGLDSHAADCCRTRAVAVGAGIASPAAVSTLFTVFVMAFRPGYRALADAADAPPLAAALAPDLPVSEVDTDPGLDPDAADSCRTRAVAVGAGLTFGERIVLSSSEAG